MSDLELATICANMELQYDDLVKVDSKEPWMLKFNVEGQDTPCTYELTLLNKMEYKNEELEGQYFKALVFRDQNGNIFVHYCGTGDGNWLENEVAYGGGPSKVQEASRIFLDKTIEKYGGSAENVYVSGHSQGGNNAQYATMTTKYGHRVSKCVSMDGQGFSHDNVAHMKNMHGEGHFENQRQKIYVVNGDADPVSTFGQTQIYPEGHQRFIETGITKDNFKSCHHIMGKLNGTSLKAETTQETPFRKFVGNLNERVCNLPQEDQSRIANVAMIVAEHFFPTSQKDIFGNYEENFSVKIEKEDLVDFLELLIPELTALMAEDPELVKSMLEYLELPDFFVDTLIVLLKNLDELSEDQRRAIYEALVDCVEFYQDPTTKEGRLKLVGDIPKILWAIFNALPAITETILDDPERIYEILKELGILEKIENLIQEYPGAALIVSLLVLRWSGKILTFAGGLVVASYVLDAIRSAIEKLQEWNEGIKNFVLNLVDTVKKTIQKIKEYLHSLLPGTKYVAANPYFKADTDKMRNYAARLNAVNSRLMQLDRNLNSLYWQVGLADLGELVTANLIITYSNNLRLARDFLNTAAEMLEQAERRAAGYMGG